MASAGSCGGALRAPAVIRSHHGRLSAPRSRPSDPLHMDGAAAARGHAPRRRPPGPGPLPPGAAHAHPVGVPPGRGHGAKCPDQPGVGALLAQPPPARPAPAARGAGGPGCQGHLVDLGTWRYGPRGGAVQDAAGLRGPTPLMSIMIVWDGQTSYSLLTHHAPLLPKHISTRAFLW